MTRDFNYQRREDQRRDSRSSSPRRYGEERSPRPARPRLKRDMVDRAWENGARQNHADYRTRSENTSNPPRDNRQRNQHPAQNSRNYRKPYGNRQDSYRPGEYVPRSNYRPRPHSYESGMRTFDDQQYAEHERRGYADRSNQAGYRPDNRPNTQYHHSRYQDREQYRGSQRREFDRDTRPPRSFNRDQQHGRDFDREGRQPHSYDRDKRSSRNDSRSATRNPRWQSRPPRQRSNYASRSQKPTRSETEQELFEGDYEHFDASNEADADHSADIPTAAPPTGKPKSRTHTASDVKRDRKTNVRRSTPKPRSTGTKPSQRGYKWPTSEA